MNHSEADEINNIDFDSPVKLHHEFKKFWEVILNSKFLLTNIRCGKLLENLEEDESTVREASKTHISLDEAKSYVVKHTTWKLEKGYKFLKKPQDAPKTNGHKAVEEQSKPLAAYKINVLPPVEDRLKDTSINNNRLKRKMSDELINTEIKRSKPELEIATQKRKPTEQQKPKPIEQPRPVPILLKGDTIELDVSQIMDLEEDRSQLSSLTNQSYTATSSNNNKPKAETVNDKPGQSAIYNRMRKPEEFKGEYLEKTDPKGQIRFYKAQVLDNYTKVETGNITSSRYNVVNYTQYFDSKDAVTNTQKAIAEQISEGYRKVPAKFQYSFNISEVTTGRGDLANLPTHHLNTKPSQSAPNSPRNSNSNSRSNSPQKIGGRANNNNFDPRDYLALDDIEEFSQTSRRTSMVDDEDDIDIESILAASKSPLISNDVQKKKNLIAEPNKDQSLGKPITNPYNSVLLAHKWEDKIDPTGYYMSEKLDGVRCLWTGTQMYSRNAKRYFPPKFFTKDFPGSVLDGELWIGRSTFQKCVSVVRKQNPIDHEWRLVQFLVFDAPGLNLPFKKRLEKLEEFFSRIDSPYIKFHKHEICKDRSHLVEEMARVESLGGEGMMLRDPNSFYENRRSKTLLKVKNFDDDEATVIGHEEGSGRCQGMMGAIRVRNNKGITFSIGSGFNDAQRRRPPPIGSMVTYKHQGVSNTGTPRFPIYLRPYTKP